MGTRTRKECLKDTSQLIKIAILLCCGIFTIFQVGECVQKLLHPPISTHYRYNLNQSVKYPCVTVCREKPYKTEVFQKFGMLDVSDLEYYFAFENFQFENYTVDELMENATYQFKEVFMLYGYAGAGGNEIIEISESLYVNRGKCFTIKPKRPSSVFSESGGYMFALRTIKMNDEDSYAGFKIYLHDPNEILTYDEYQRDSFLEYIHLEASEDMSVRLEVQEYGRLPMTDNQCSDERDYSISKCQEACISQKVAAKANCYLPWLFLPKDHTYEECDNYKSVRNLISDYSNNREDYRQSCNCPTVCNFTVYKTSVLRRTAINKSNAPNSLLKIYYDSNLVTLMCDVIGYDWNQLLSDIGGSLGFLLGLSVIGLIYMVEKIFQFIFKWMSRRKLTKLEELKHKNQPEQDTVPEIANDTPELRRTENNNCQTIEEYMDKLNTFENNLSPKGQDIKY